ncbi:MAG: PQQ-dependent dehydrogenase, methanol/ethanol family [Candidatus Rokubacteria bacterium]|nr:PQQ-dependent dehydrogenase, methanol/ethanol family [Candidatus Rokubacteria bacterium]
MKPRKRSGSLLLPSCLAVLFLLSPGGVPALAQVTHTPVSEQMLMNAAADGKNWLTYGKNYANTRYSPSRQINAQNASLLVPRWVYQTGGPIGSFETTPLVVNGIMYLTTPFNHAIAVDAKTGKQLWRYEHKIAGTPIICCGPNNRGLTAWGDRVYMATLDAHLVALDQKTGKVVWDVEVADATAGYSLTLAPLAYKGMIIVGNSGAEYGVRGFVDAYSAADGKRVWRFWTIPDTGWEGKFSPTTPEGEKLNREINKEKADFAKYKDAWQRGGGSTWMTPAVDPETDTLFIMVGNPSPDLDGEIRPGDNLYTESMVAIDVRNGTYKWHYQYVPHDVWDLDAVSPAVLFETMADGRRVKAVGHAGKTGWFYIHDRATGKLIRRSQPFVPQENMFAQPTPTGVRMLPGANGGSEWSPVAYSPVTQMVYVLGLHQPMWYITHSSPFAKGKLWLGSAFVSIPGEEQWGTFTAIDVNTGKIAWQNKLPDPLIGGALATAGGVVFTGGDGTGNFYAFDAMTGKEIWRFNCGAGVNAAPISFEIDGEQFIAVAAGGVFQTNYRYGDTVFVFGLPKK